jgi:hypothetical protein
LQSRPSLDLQERTIKHHMTQILQKLHLRNCTKAAIMAQWQCGDGHQSLRQKKAAPKNRL